MAFNKLFTRRRALAAGTVGVASAAGVIGVAAGSGAVLSGCDTGSCEDWSAEHEPKAVTGPSSVNGQHVLANLADIPVGQSVTARTADGDPVIVSRTAEAIAVAFSASCTHHGCVVNPDGNRLHCPPHDGYFSSSTGKSQGGPPKKALTPVNVTVVDGKVVSAS